MINFSKAKVKQFLNRVKLRKTTPTNLIINIIEKLNVNFTEKKHLKFEPNIKKLTLFLTKK
ncbi:hypothetical protein HYN56_02330 [Flavobacterium crocinum]|uniref:Uncharacterized protein n=1 Tax=Flavobacterium crocinum TaxID=2183896 RepID=A0A2S1YGD4_9FLAO|nr:hypothetical protein HYN56_02330 [Flavobacterium crocinum]